MVSLSLASVGLGALPAGAAEPTLGLRATRETFEVKRRPGRAAWIDPGVFVFAQGGPLELWLTRSAYDQPLELSQVVQGPGGEEVRPLDVGLLDSTMGLNDFLDLVVTNSKGEVVKKRSLTFCPNSYDPQRLNDEGPSSPSYPQWCAAGPFTKGMVWGIDQGWATNVMTYNGLRLREPDGRYKVSFSIAPAYLDLFEVDPSAATASIKVKLETSRRCHHGCFSEPQPVANRQMIASTGVPTMAEPDPQHLPDLVGLPAWGMDVQNERRKEKEFLRFGATVWVGGAAPLHVEGFRRQSEDVMDGFQYFYQGDEIVGRAEVGTLEFDDRRGHTHWHFQQFAEYRLVGADGSEVIKSTKEAFCLAPTDPIDLTILGADWSPDEIGFGRSNCGWDTSLWVKEVLPLGWGDTYIQSRPGQSFNITNLPNGTYYVEVEANPGLHLKEQDPTNNVERRKVIIKGKPGARFVRVPPWNGIDTENYWEGGFMRQPAG
jgi:hypothetical protein